MGGLADARRLDARRAVAAAARILRNGACEIAEENARNDFRFADWRGPGRKQKGAKQKNAKKESAEEKGSEGKKSARTLI
jgi:hypothetical protein